MGFQVLSIVNEPVNSNTFIVFTTGEQRCIVIDPGSEKAERIVECLERNHLVPELIFLTHEHFDHIWSADYLRDKYRSKLICSRTCSEAINNSKKNLSLFYNQIGFTIKKADIVVEDINYSITWNNHDIKFIPTQGHSNAGISILIENYLFPGDNIITGEKTVVKLPTGNILKLEESLSLLLSLIDDSTKILGGHGVPFYKIDIDIALLLGKKI
jgi:hydroxyacylglutathione hydrolase